VQLAADAVVRAAGAALLAWMLRAGGPEEENASSAKGFGWLFAPLAWENEWGFQSKWLILG